MITEFDLDAAIAECQGEKNPDSKTCMKLAAFYIIKNEMFGGKQEQAEMPLYSYEAAPNQNAETITYQGKTEFAKLIYGRNSNEMWGRIDDFMSNLQMLNKRLYNSVLNNIAEG